MFRTVILTLGFVASLVAARPSIDSVKRATAYEIRGVTDPIFHLYLQALPGSASKPVLGPAASADNYTISNAIRSSTTGRYLNINTAPTSYKPLSFGSTSNTTAWGLEGDTIITTTGSTYGRRMQALRKSEYEERLIEKL
ncbi:MAG: hypothetical protein Q9227_001257 [Pyrenula ochraceoflavens]